MRAVDYIVMKIVEYGGEHAFGIPGGVILKFLYAMEENPAITIHLMLHEQSAGFAACGYAQASGKLGVAYATRGPGITNMITCIAEAYQESLPVLFVTAHEKRGMSGARFDYNQELDIVKMVSNITKYAISVDDVESLCYEVDTACHMALDGRPGPVLLDLSSSIYDKEIPHAIKSFKPVQELSYDCTELLMVIKQYVREAQKPVILIGDGIRNTVSDKVFNDFISKVRIPILSSRGSQDILMHSSYYYGYIGSHGMRYSNFILSKADLIISFGNRLAFPLMSESYAPIFDRTKLIRIDIDDMELARKIKNSENYKADVGKVIRLIADDEYGVCAQIDWVEKCDKLKDALQDYDKPEPVQRLMDFMRQYNEEETIYVTDVGNNEFYASRALEAVHPDAQIYCSKSYGTFGVALGRSIGVYYATGKNTVCIMGDQGFQCNAQDLSYITKHKLPIKVIVLNDKSSGMIADCERKIFKGKLLHVNEESGYYPAEIEAVAKTYGFGYTNKAETVYKSKNLNMIYEITYSGNLSLTPNLPRGNECQNMEPLIESNVYELLNNI